MNVWELEIAKQRFDEMIKKVHADGPQEIIDYNKESVFVISANEYQKINKKKQKGSIIEFFNEAPSGFADLEIGKNKSVEIQKLKLTF